MWKMRTDANEIPGNNEFAGNPESKSKRNTARSQKILIDQSSNLEEEHSSCVLDHGLISA